MTFDLTEARRLHDRSTHEPSECGTCHDSWPCATAIALGATGRSEWTDTTNRNGYRTGDCDNTTDCTGPLDHPGPCTPPWTPCATYSTRGQGSKGPCVRDAIHEAGPHRDANGDTW